MEPNENPFEGHAPIPASAAQSPLIGWTNAGNFWYLHAVGTDEVTALRVDNERLLNRNLELVQENKKLRRRLRVLRRLVAPLIEGLKYHPKQPHYFLRLQHPEVQRLTKFYALTEEPHP